MVFYNINNNTEFTTGKLYVVEGGLTVEQDSEDMEAFVNKHA